MFEQTEKQTKVVDLSNIKSYKCTNVSIGGYCKIELQNKELNIHKIIAVVDATSAVEKKKA